VQLTEAIRLRRSTAPTTDTAPGDSELARCLAMAAHSPDHAGLRPWRLVTVRGTDRVRLGEAMAAGFGDEAGSAAAAKTAAKTMRSPLLVGIIAVPVEHPKVPEWEQIAAIGALVATLELVLFDAGYTAMWRTGPGVGLSEVQRVMGVGPDERLLGWLYVGGTVVEPAAPSADPDVTGRITPRSGTAG
jgi:nitroreductase